MMSKNYLWTESGMRLQLIKSQAGKPYQWLFLPGGPGIGSEYFSGLTYALNVPGSIWHMDLPGSGSNRRDMGGSLVEKWGEALLEAVKCLENVILVGHSFGGMLILSLPELEKHLKGLILLNTSPGCHLEASWKSGLENGLPDMADSYRRYIANPSEETMKMHCKDAIPYWFTHQAWKTGLNMIEDVPLNHRAYQAGEAFFKAYEAKWVPHSLKTLVICAEKDFVMPSYLFKESARFQLPSIWVVEVNEAGHFPWIENAKMVAHYFQQYVEWLL
ncbi:alpha/beta fold hydrolase [Candidatus Protochlamydia phocaeensis]|uniref:alpha/beta fold hydrolase n=1 Tax=Candidatus Protochlamydia phocaeensis TaxID=1414722 RepID=UPI000839A9E4|nr:alpha/beta hydrolase [Candidatus Protochlamydia phocaeensis]